MSIQSFSNLSTSEGLANNSTTLFEQISQYSHINPNSLVFSLIGPDGLSKNYFKDIWKKLEQAGFKIMAFKYLFTIPKTSVEILYQFDIANATAFKLNEFELLSSKFGSSASLALILYKPQSPNASNELLKLKGSIDVFNNAENTLRFYMDSPIFSLIHCSDNLELSFKEALFFFKYDNILKNIKNKSNYSFEYLMEYCQYMAKLEAEYRFPLLFVRLKMKLLLYDATLSNSNKKLFDFYKIWINIFETLYSGKKQMIKIIEFLKLENEILNNEEVIVNNYDLLLYFNDFRKFKFGYFEKALPKIVGRGIILSEREKLVFASAISYFRMPA